MQQINILALVLHAGLVVKFVLLLLLGFSVISWFIVFQKLILFRRTRGESSLFQEQFWKSKNLAEAHNHAVEANCPEAAIFRLGYNELQKLAQRRTAGSDATETLEMRAAGMENLKRALRKGQNIELNLLGKSLSFLATTGSATPFIGLFGTVWGIMNSFHEIGMRGSASLAVVAPGISEALVATAVGLAVAIPAVIFYNYYAKQLDDLEDNMQSFAIDFLNLIERDIVSRSEDRTT